MSQAVELPEKMWSALEQAAKASGVTPVDWIAARLPSLADAKGASPAQVEADDPDEKEPPTYTSVPLERVGVVQVEFVAGSERPPLPYPLEDDSE